VNIRQSIPFGLIALMMANAASSQSYPSFPGEETDQRTLRTQERVDVLFNSGAYDRAYLIYRKDLAPRGDKYAQYMIGFMHLTGAGVPEDAVVALAWYRIAAERGEPSVSLARDQLEKTLTASQIAAADALFADLRNELGDRVLLLKLVRHDLNILRSSASGGVSPSTANMTIIDRRYGVASGTYYYQMIRKRLNRRLTYLKGHVKVVDVEGDPYTMELVEIESEIKALMAEIDKRQ
jgi:TPR repeat protein